jgi:hypothetical protein
MCEDDGDRPRSAPHIGAVPDEGGCMLAMDIVIDGAAANSRQPGCGHFVPARLSACVLNPAKYRKLRTPTGILRALDRAGSNIEGGAKDEGSCRQRSV